MALAIGYGLKKFKQKKPRPDSLPDLRGRETDHAALAVAYD
jgi:hypothetical protein